MSKLVKFLKENKNINESVEKPEEIADENTDASKRADDFMIDYEIMEAKFSFIDLEDLMSKEEYKEIVDSVFYDVEGQEKLNRDQLVEIMYGHIKNPKTKKRFQIPGLDFNDIDYNKKYANFMRMLVKSPKDFVKAMKWE